MTETQSNPSGVIQEHRVQRIVERGRSPWGPLLFKAYRIRFLRPVVRRLMTRLEGGIMCSVTWRKILREYEGVALGEFSRGAGIRPGLFPSGTSIGRFSCFAVGLQVLRRNHPAGRFSQHPVFFNPLLGLAEKDSRPAAHSNHLTIGNDVWVGMNVIICPGCRSVGDGAIIGAGSVVTRDVPPFTVVAGNPARPIKKRFSPEVESAVVESQWWHYPLPDLVRHVSVFNREITDESLERFRAAFPPESAPCLAHE